MPVEIREFTPDDHAAVFELWRATPGVVVRDVDARAPIIAYLARNPGMSFVATADGVVVGAVLCGTDGRRGYLHHLAVHPEHRRQGIGSGLVQRGLRALERAGIDKCHLMVLADNQDAREFWTRLGWQARPDVDLMSHTNSGVATA
jgi:N-acetylglutamate synthase